MDLNINYLAGMARLDDLYREARAERLARSARRARRRSMWTEPGSLLSLVRRGGQRLSPPRQIPANRTSSAAQSSVRPQPRSEAPWPEALDLACHGHGH